MGYWDFDAGNCTTVDTLTIDRGCAGGQCWQFVPPEL